MDILYISLASIIASGIGTITGFGTSMALIPILLLFMPIDQTILLVGIIHFCNNIWKIILFRKGFNWKLVLSFGLPGIVAAWAGASLSLMVDRILLMHILGVFLIMYVIFLFVKSSFKLPHTTLSAMGGGTASGFFAGLFGIGGAVRGMFLTAYHLPKAVYLSTAGAISLFIDASRLTTYIAGGTKLNNHILYGLIIFIPASYFGARISKKIVDKIPQEYFRYVIAVFLLIVGLKLLISP